MTDYTILPTDKLEFAVTPDGVRLTQDINGEESIIWIADSQLRKVIDILDCVATDFDI